MKFLEKNANKKHDLKFQNRCLSKRMKEELSVNVVDVEIGLKSYYYVMDVILDIIWTVWFLPYLENLEVDGIVQHVNPLVLSVIILLNVQGLR
jgi:hypothetical protein